MEKFEGEESIAVGSTGTLLSLIGKEMEVLQARKSCSVSSYGVMSKRSPSAERDYQSNTYMARNVYHGSPALPFSTSASNTTSAASMVSSLWSDLKGLLRSPTSIHHSAPDPNAPLQYDSSIYFCREDIMEDDDDHDDEHAEQFDVALFNKRSSPRRSISLSRKTYPKEKCPAAVAVLDSRARAESKESRLKGKATSEKWHCAAVSRGLVDDTPSFPAYPYRRAVDTHARGTASTSTARTWSGSCVASDADHKLHAKAGKEKAASGESSSYSTSRRREERELSILCKMQQERRNQERECFKYWECGCSCMYCIREEDKNELLYAYDDHASFHSNLLMKRPLMLKQTEDPSTQAASPNLRAHAARHHRLTTLLLKPSRSLVGGRSSLAAVSVVDLQCCHSGCASSLVSTPTITKKLPFTRLSQS